MKLSRAFSFATTRLREAIKENDIAEVELLRRKKDPFLFGSVLNGDMEKISPEMADKFLSFTDNEWQRWGCKPDSHDIVVGALMSMAMVEGRGDLFSRYIDSGISFNRGEAEGHVIHFILEGKLTQDQKAEFTGRILRDGIDKVADAQNLLKEAARYGCPGAFDLLATALGDGLHKNNEELLRVTAQTGQKEMCRHLVEQHGCNIDLAITTSRTLGQQDTWLFLDNLRSEIKPGETAPPTIESLAAELTELKATVRAMAVLLAERDREKSLDKPALTPPTLKAS